METKEKIIKLINACIDDKKFYNNQANKNFSIKHYEWSVEKPTKELFLEYLTKDNLLYVNVEDREKYIDELRKVFNFSKVKFPYPIDIKFDNEPPIHICLEKVEISKKQCAEQKAFNSGDTFQRVEKERKLFFFTKQKIVRYNQAVIMVPYIVDLDYKVVVTLGSLKCEITKEEFENFSKRILENRIKFKEIRDTDILEERIKTFCKE